MKRKQVIFHYGEGELLHHALSKENFSDYVKALIEEDRKKIVKPSIYDIYKNKREQP